MVQAQITAVLYHTNMLSFDFCDLCMVITDIHPYISLTDTLEKAAQLLSTIRALALLFSVLAYCVGALLLFGLEKVAEIQRKIFVCICVSQSFQQHRYLLYFRLSCALCKYFLGIYEVSFCVWGRIAGMCILLCRILLQFSVGDYTCSSCSIMKEEQENIQNTSFTYVLTTDVSS